MIWIFDIYTYIYAIVSTFAPYPEALIENYYFLYFMQYSIRNVFHILKYSEK